VNTREAVAPWCSVDVSSGNLTVVLEPYNCFDAEVYGDELQLEEPIEFREDQRSMNSHSPNNNLPCANEIDTVSLGRWILRYLFANLIDEEIKRDEAYRHKLNEGVESRQAALRTNAPTSIALPQPIVTSFESTEAVTTPRANGNQLNPVTPGFGIGLATPAPNTALSASGEGGFATSPMSPSEKRKSATSPRPTDKDDYFTSSIRPADSGQKPAGTPATQAPDAADPKTPAEGSGDKGKDKDKDKEKAGDSAKSPTTAFGKKFRMSFGTKKLGRSASTTAPEKPAVVDEKAEESESSSNHEKEVEDNFYGAVQKIHQDYERNLTEFPHKLVETRLTPSLPSETPVLKLPPNTKVIIQEETSGGSANIYQGTVESVGKDADAIEQKGPMWLGHLLLQNQTPYKDPVKISFVLHPLDNLPAIAAADGNNRLNANRMLRVRKILSYVAERIEAPEEEPQADPLKPEEYLELYCNDQVSHTTSNL
jgi:WD repeat-containing protein 48